MFARWPALAVPIIADLDDISLGPELVSNSRFASGTSGYAPIISVLSAANGVFSMRHQTAAPDYAGRTRWTLAQIPPGRSVRLQITVVALAGASIGTQFSVGGDLNLNNTPQYPTATKQFTGVGQFAAVLKNNGSNPGNFGFFVSGGNGINSGISVTEFSARLVL